MKHLNVKEAQNKGASIYDVRKEEGGRSQEMQQICGQTVVFCRKRGVGGQKSQKSENIIYGSKLGPAVVLRGPVLLKAHKIFKNKEQKQGFNLSKKNNSCTLTS